VCSKDAILVDGKYPPQSVRPKLVQTPQGFRTADLIKAMEQAYVDQTLSSFKDDSSIVAHYLGFTPEEVEGDYENIKITTKDDLRWLG
jgi:2-C-methyl-D-erythritol 4-phosphate cytidylyltransferase